MIESLIDTVLDELIDAVVAEGKQLLDALPSHHSEFLSSILVRNTTGSDSALALCVRHRLSARNQEDTSTSQSPASTFEPPAAPNSGSSDKTGVVSILNMPPAHEPLQASSPPISERTGRGRRPATHRLTSTDTCNAFWSASRVWQELHEVESTLRPSGEQSLSSSPRECDDEKDDGGLRRLPSVSSSHSEQRERAHTHTHIKLCASSVTLMHGLKGVKDALRDHCNAGLQLRALLEATRFSAERRAGRYAQELKQMKRRNLAGIYPMELETQLAMCRHENSVLERKVANQERDLRAACAQEAMTVWSNTVMLARHFSELHDSQRDWQRGTQLFVKELERNAASKSSSFRAWLSLSSYHTHLKRAHARIQTRKRDKQASTAAARCVLFFLHLKYKVKDKSHLARWVGALEERRLDKCFQRWCNVLEAHAKLLDLARVRLALRRLRKSWTRWHIARGRAKTEALKFYFKSSRLSSSLAISSIFCSDYSSANVSPMGSCALNYWHQNLKSSLPGDLI